MKSNKMNKFTIYTDGSCNGFYKNLGEMKLKWYIKQKWQKLTRGYSDEELWNLDSTICKWLLPRLKTFKEKTIGFPPTLNSPEEWDDILEKIILALELHISDLPDSPEQVRVVCEQIEEGFELFGKYFCNLWW